MVASAVQVAKRALLATRCRAHAACSEAGCLEKDWVVGGDVDFGIPQSRYESSCHSGKVMPCIYLLVCLACGRSVSIEDAM